jgi:SAM-dependent methyltransferase
LTPGLTILAKLLPRRLRRRLRIAPRRIVGRVRHRGSRVQCPCCRREYRELAPLHGSDRLCWHCGSLERDRLLWLFFDRNPGLLAPGLNILHVAPEAPLQRRLQNVAGRYVSGDLHGVFGDHIIDITSLDFPDASFDAVMCNHVLEHVPDDRGAMRELRRVLRADGWAILLVPDVHLQETMEDPSIADAADRLRLFGQEDHVRRYGLDYFDRLAGAGFTTESIDLSEELSSEEITRHRLRKFGELERIFLCR